MLPGITPVTTQQGGSLINILGRLNLTSGLTLCLDAGDSASYTSGQSWLDRSGGGYDFFLGLDGSATATDPTFNGVAGALSSAEFFSFDGGDLFTYDTTNETWMNNLHKDSAAYTIVGYVYIAASVGIQCVVSTFVTNSTGTGFRFRIAADETLNILVQNGGAAVLSTGTTATISTGAWHFIAVAVDEAAGTGTFQIDGTQASFTSTYSSPSTGNAESTMALASRGDTNQTFESGGRMAAMAAWTTKLTDASLTSIYSATKTRFGV